jgi:hypothetical protein
MTESQKEESALETPKSPEQSENVIENKGRDQQSTTPDPSLSKEGNGPADGSQLMAQG